MNLHRNLQIAKAVVASTALAVLAGCDGTNAKEVVHVPQPVVATTYVALGAGGVDRRDVFTTVVGGVATPVDDTTSIPTTLEGGIALDQAGNLVQVSAGTDVIRTFCAAGALADPVSADSFRTITGVTNPVHIDIAHEAGAYVVTNNTDTIQVYYSGAAGAAGAAGTYTTTGNGPAWGVAYDDVADRLFIARTDGIIEVVDDFVAEGFGATSTVRLIDTGTAADEDETGTVDFRGIAYDPQQDRLVVADVGAVANATDGRLLIIENASLAEGTGTDPDDTDPFVVPDVVIAGASTGLGDPMALSLKGVSLRVADSGSDQVLFYQNIFAAGFGLTADATTGAFDAAPTEATASTDPTAVIASSTRVFPTANDAGSGTGTIAYVNNAAVANQIQHVDLTDLSLDNTFDTGEAAVWGLDFDPNGDGYVTVDDGGGNGSLLALHRLAKGRDGGTFDADRDRVLAADLVAPKGVAVLGNTGFVAVAENDAGAPGIYVYGACGSGLTAVTTVETGAQPWGLDYDATTDRLFVALTDGTFEIYRNFFNVGVLSAIDDPTFEISPLVTVTLDDGTTSAVNLHGVHYTGGTLFLSDVGDPGVATDGGIWVVRNIAALIAYVRDPAQNGNGAGNTGDAISTLTLPIRVEDDCQNVPVAPAACTPTVGSATNPSPDDDDGDGDPSDADESPEYENDPFLVAGDATTVLGNPVDLTFDGANLYVAEKTSTTPGILIFEDFLDNVLATDDPDADADGVSTAANIIPVALDADDSVGDGDVESVSAVPDYLSVAP